MRTALGFVVGLGLAVSFSAQAVEVEGFDNGPPCTGGGLLWDATAATWGDQIAWTLGRASFPMAPDDCYGRATFSPLLSGEAIAGKSFAVSTGTGYMVSFYARHRPDRDWADPGPEGICWFEVDYAWGDHDSVWVRDVGALTVMAKWIETDPFSQAWALYSDSTDEDSGSNTFITLALKAGTTGSRHAIPHIDHLDLKPAPSSVYNWSVYD